MLVHTAYLTCREDVLEKFRARLLRHAATTEAAEPGCLAFLIRQDRDSPTRFLLIEHYADEDALALHREAPHYLAFRADVADWVVKREWWFWDPLN
ncbi:putative quinol monooxygenase [Acuticoccus kandeliae]|uniref:putative quinol monooxygenase n=1 Tax=Acuticoccus kandeliae TaxID=2073160 RepID=UPI000D3EB645|nr:putative quinol monooxygenase [Acuticoccus kandeliae]